MESRERGPALEDHCHAWGYAPCPGLVASGKSPKSQRRPGEWQITSFSLHLPMSIIRMGPFCLRRWERGKKSLQEAQGEKHRKTGHEKPDMDCPIRSGWLCTRPGAARSCIHDCAAWGVHVSCVNDGIELAWVRTDEPGPLLLGIPIAVDLMDACGLSLPERRDAIPITHGNRFAPSPWGIYVFSITPRCVSYGIPLFLSTHIRSFRVGSRRTSILWRDGPVDPSFLAGLGASVRGGPAGKILRIRSWARP